VLPGSRVVFDGPDRLHFLAAGGAWEVLRVSVEVVPGPERGNPAAREQFRQVVLHELDRARQALAALDLTAAQKSEVGRLLAGRARRLEGLVDRIRAGRATPREALEGAAAAADLGEDVRVVVGPDVFPRFVGRFKALPAPRVATTTVSTEGVRRVHRAFAQAGPSADQRRRFADLASGVTAALRQLNLEVGTGAVDPESQRQRLDALRDQLVGGVEGILDADRLVKFRAALDAAGAGHHETGPAAPDP
jgi:hypothetical protein